MSFIVRHRRDGQSEPVYETFDSMEDAIGRIEALHTDADIVDSALFRQVSVRVERVVKVTIEDEPDVAAPQVDEASAQDLPPAGTAAAPPPGAMPLTPSTVPSAASPVTGSEESRKGRFSR